MPECLNGKCGNVAGFLSLASQKMVCISDNPQSLLRAMATAELPDASEKLGKLQRQATQLHCVAWFCIVCMLQELPLVLYPRKGRDVLKLQSSAKG